MPPVDRFTVSLDTELLAAFDAYIASRGYVNRSEAVRDLIREALITNRLLDGVVPVVAIITFVCDHRSVAAPRRARRVILEARALSPACTQTPIDADRDLWTVGVRGPSQTVQSFSNRIQAIRGVSAVRTLFVPETE